MDAAPNTPPLVGVAVRTTDVRIGLAVSSVWALVPTPTWNSALRSDQRQSFNWSLVDRKSGTIWPRGMIYEAEVTHLRQAVQRMPSLGTPHETTSKEVDNWLADLDQLAVELAFEEARERATDEHRS